MELVSLANASTFTVDHMVSTSETSYFQLSLLFHILDLSLYIVLSQHHLNVIKSVPFKTKQI